MIMVIFVVRLIGKRFQRRPSWLRAGLMAFQADVQMQKIAKFLGHTSMMVPARTYAPCSPNCMKDAAAALDWRAQGPAVAAIPTALALASICAGALHC